MLKLALLPLVFLIGAAGCQTARTTAIAKKKTPEQTAKDANRKTSPPPTTTAITPKVELAPDAPTARIAPPTIKGELWRAQIGKTHYRSTIHVDKGLVIVGTNGNDWKSISDQRDALYLINGNDGTIVKRIVPPGPKGEKDVNGVALDGQVMIFGTDQGIVHAFNRQGAALWSRDIGGDAEAAPALADFDGDGVKDVAIGAEGGSFYLLNGRNGAVMHILRSETGDYGQRGFNAPAALFDANGDGVADVFAPGRDNVMHAIDGRTGKQMWKIARTSGMHSAPIIVDTNGDGAREVVFTEAYSDIMAADPKTGQIVWKHTLSHPTGGIEGLFGALTWLPSKGCALIGTAWWESNEGLYCVGPQGVVWRHTEPTKNITSGAVIGDIDGKPGEEIVFGTESGRLIALDNNGREVWSEDLGSPIECTPTLADLDGDGRHEILVAARDGVLRAFKTPGLGPATLPYHRGDPQNTGVLD